MEKGDAVLNAISNNQSMEYGANKVLSVDGTKGIRLPSGLYMQYPDLSHLVTPDGWRKEWS